MKFHLLEKWRQAVGVFCLSLSRSEDFMGKTQPRSVLGNCRMGWSFLPTVGRVQRSRLCVDRWEGRLASKIFVGARPSFVGSWLLTKIKTTEPASNQCLAASKGETLTHLVPLVQRFLFLSPLRGTRCVSSFARDKLWRPLSQRSKEDERPPSPLTRD